MNAVELKVIPGAAHALGFRGNRFTLNAQDEMLAREWRRYNLAINPEQYVGYFADHPEQVNAYRAMLTAPPPAVVDGPVTAQLRTARAALDAAIVMAEQLGA